MAYIEERKTKDGKIHYRVLVRLRGYPQASATFDRITDAKKWAQQTEASMREGRYFRTSESKKHTVADLVDRYIENIIPSKPKNAPATTAQLNWWKAELGYCLLSDLTPSLIAEKRDKLLRGITPQGKQRSPGTVVRYLAALSHALTIASKEWGWLEDSPMRNISKPKEPRGRTRFLSETELSVLLHACQESSNPYLYLVVVLALATGMRQGEIMNLRWEDVDLFRARITLHQTKNNEVRIVPLRGYVLSLMKEYAAARQQNLGLLFPSQNPQKPMDLRFPWKQALMKAGIENYRFHDNRHSCASYLLMSGASLAELAEILGHKTLQMVKRYSHLSETHAGNVIEHMNQILFGEQ